MRRSVQKFVLQVRHQSTTAGLALSIFCCLLLSHGKLGFGKCSQCRVDNVAALALPDPASEARMPRRASSFREAKTWLYSAPVALGAPHHSK
jgi:hypothetical protein